MMFSSIFQYEYKPEIISDHENSSVIPDAFRFPIGMDFYKRHVVNTPSTEERQWFEEEFGMYEVADMIRFLNEPTFFQMQEDWADDEERVSFIVPKDRENREGQLTVYNTSTLYKDFFKNGCFISDETVFTPTQIDRLLKVTKSTSLVNLIKEIRLGKIPQLETTTLTPRHYRLFEACKIMMYETNWEVIDVLKPVISLLVEHLKDSLDQMPYLRYCEKAEAFQCVTKDIEGKPFPPFSIGLKTGITEAENLAIKLTKKPKNNGF